MLWFHGTRRSWNPQEILVWDQNYFVRDLGVGCAMYGIMLLRNVQQNTHENYHVVKSQPTNQLVGCIINKYHRGVIIKLCLNKN